MDDFPSPNDYLEQGNQEYKESQMNPMYYGESTDSFVQRFEYKVRDGPKMSKAELNESVEPTRRAIENGSSYIDEWRSSGHDRRVSSVQRKDPGTVLSNAGKALAQAKGTSYDLLKWQFTAPTSITRLGRKG